MSSVNEVARVQFSTDTLLCGPSQCASSYLLDVLFNTFLPSADAQMSILFTGLPKILGTVTMTSPFIITAWHRIFTPFLRL